jgi:hypothetical protein
MMSTVQMRKQIIWVTVFVVVVFAFLLYFPGKNDWTYLEIISSASTNLIGKPNPTDIIQDFIGFRSLIEQSDPYPILGPAFYKIGIDWPVDHVSTHPPTAFLFTAPVAFLYWPIASALWSYMMIGCIILSLYLFDLPWRESVVIGLWLLFWPPAILSLGQLTAIWLLGSVIAYRFREDKPLFAGCGIGLAALTKFAPAVMLAYFIIKRRWQAVVGFSIVFLIGFAVVHFIHPGAFPRYLEVNQSNLLNTAMRIDNGSLPVALWKFYGNLGLLIGVFVRFRLYISSGLAMTCSSYSPIYL